MSFGERLAHAWDAFTNNDRSKLQSYGSYGVSYGSRPDRIRLATGDKSIISSIYNRIAIDVAAITIEHVNTDSDGQYLSTRPSGLNNCLTVEANLDQAARAFRLDMVLSLFDKGTIAIVPVETTLDPTVSQAYDILTMRVGEIVAWYPNYVQCNVYNEATGRKELLTLSKDYVAIVENPLYTVMNEPNGTLQRLIRKLSLLDSIDEQVGSGKLDLIIQLPYAIKTETRQIQADNRRKDIEMQLKGSQYGIAYTDATEKITQLNRPAENNMLAQVTYLTNMLYSQLGITEDVFNGTANEATMLNYYNRTVEPILAAITESMKRTFLTKTARTQNQSIQYFRDPFKLMPMSDVANIANALSRNEIITANEIRTRIGFKPSSDPNADKLVNSNMPQPNSANAAPVSAPVAPTATPVANSIASLPKTPTNASTNFIAKQNSKSVKQISS